MRPSRIKRRKSQRRQGSLPLIGEVTAAGKRVIDFQHELVRRYEGELENSEVLVTLENGAAAVIISGFANKPGKLFLIARRRCTRRSWKRAA